MLQNDYLVVKIGVDAAENEPFKSGDVVTAFRFFSPLYAAEKGPLALYKSLEQSATHLSHCYRSLKASAY